MRLIIRFVAVLAWLVFAGAAYAQETPVKSFPVFGDAFFSRLSPDGALLATFESGVIHNDEIIADYLPIRVYDVTRGEAVATLTGEPDYAIDVAFSPDGAQLAALYSTGWLHVWNVADGETVARLPVAPNGARLAWLADNQTVAIGAGQFPQIQLWDIPSGAMTALLTERFTTLAEQREALSSGVPNGLAAFAAAPDGDLLAISTFFDTVELWTRDGEMVTLYDEGTEQPMLSILALTFTPDGSRLVALHTREGQLLVFDVASRRLEATIDAAGARGRALAVSADGAQAAWVAAPTDEPPRVVVANLESGETREVALSSDVDLGSAFPMMSLFFSSDGQRLILTGQFARFSSDLEPGQNPVYLIPLPQ